MISEILALNATLEFMATERWALSVAYAPGLSAAEIAEAWPYRGLSMQASTASQLLEKGFTITKDDVMSVHGLLMLPGVPTERTWEDLRSCFGPPMPNPAYEE